MKNATELDAQQFDSKLAHQISNNLTALVEPITPTNIASSMKGNELYIP